MKPKPTMNFREGILIHSNAIEDSIYRTRGELVQSKPLICALSTDIGLSVPNFNLQDCLYCIALLDDADVALVWTNQLLEPTERNKIP